MKFKHGTRRRASEYEPDLMQWWKDHRTFKQNQEIARRSDKVAGVFCRQNYFSRNRQSKLLN